MPDFADSPDYLSRSNSLRVCTTARSLFDPTNKEHLESLRSFIQTGNWGKAQFLCEFPFTDVPMTVLIKFAGHHLKASRETHAQRLVRMNEKAAA